MKKTTLILPNTRKSLKSNFSNNPQGGNQRRRECYIESLAELTDSATPVTGLKICSGSTCQLPEELQGQGMSVIML